MRLIATLSDQNAAYQLSTYLHQLGIENQLELVTNSDWGSPEYGTMVGKIWAQEEDQFEEAMRIAEEFQNNPQDPRFQSQGKVPPLFQDEEPEEQSTITINPPGAIPVRVRERQGMGTITFYILVICTLLLMLANATTPAVKAVAPSIPIEPVLFSKSDKELIYDYPHAYELIDRIVDTYGLESVENIDKLPPGGQALLRQYKDTPYWQGIYDKVVAYLKNRETPWNFNAPLFEKVREGQVWRLFTPIFLHANFIHLFFNMIWLIVIGRQMEQRLGPWRYILFIAIVGLISNTAQYLMSGGEFMGFSGVICGMIAFVWARQQRSGWEGYQLDRSTLIFIAFFILFMFAIQTVAFIFEVTNESKTMIGIANTAHLTGALAGYLLGKMDFFAWKRIKSV